MKRIIIASLFFAALGVNTSFAQQQLEKNPDKEKLPLWILLMDDTLTNYYEAQKSFEAFWKNRPLPIEEEEIIGHSEQPAAQRKSRLLQLFTTKQERRAEEAERYAFQYKRFKHWERAMLPYVQDDGSILTPTQRLEIWKHQRSN